MVPNPVTLATVFTGRGRGSRWGLLESPGRLELAGGRQMGVALPGMGVVVVDKDVR